MEHYKYFTCFFKSKISSPWDTRNRTKLFFNNHLNSSAASGTRTRTTLPGQGILSPSCLPFHHHGIISDCKGNAISWNSQINCQQIESPMVDFHLLAYIIRVLVGTVLGGNPANIVLQDLVGGERHGTVVVALHLVES